MTPASTAVWMTGSAGVGSVDRVYTDIATFVIGPDGVRVTETFGVSFDELAERLEVPLVRE
jgi:3-oxoadipate CoA-transferase, beta subunit